MRVVSLGAGVQSSALLLLGLEGRFGDKPDCAVFADTQWEPRAVYDWLDRLKEEVHPFPIHVVSKGSILHNLIRSAAGKEERGDGRFVNVPYYLQGQDGTPGMGRRQCTTEFKLGPLQKLWRSLGATAKNPVESWIGISTDEAHRMKPSRVKYAVNRYPLIEAGLSREDCEDYLRERLGAVAPKSSCIGCPFHGDAYWLRLRAEEPDSFDSACYVDRMIRKGEGMRALQFTHRSLRPLEQVTFKHEGQGAMFMDAFGNDCEGMCGL